MDYYPDAAKKAVLLSLLKGKHPKQSFVNAIALLQLDPDQVPKGTISKGLIEESLKSVEGRPEFIRLVEKYKVTGLGPELMAIALQAPSDEMRSNALNALLNTGGKALVQEKLYGDTAIASKIIALLGRSGTNDNLTLLESLVLDDQYQPQLRILATKTLGKGWRGENRLLEIIDAGRLPQAVDSAAMETLLSSYREDVRKRAAVYFNIQTDKGASLLPVEQLVQLKGDPQKGTVIFSNYCNSCHVVNGKGINFGPDLSQIGAKLAKDALYKAIISPDAGISFGYEGYLIKLKDGKELLGYIASETADELSVKVIGGDEHKVFIRDIVSRKPYEHSLMPTGLEKSMSQNQLVDLVDYLTTLK